MAKVAEMAEKASRFRVGAFLPLLLLCALSCSEPASVERFIRADEAVNGVYVFQLDMTDSLAFYDLSLYTSVDAPLLGAGPEKAALALEVSLYGPGTALSETVYLPCGDRKGSCRLYRTGVRPSSPGIWNLSLRPVDPPSGLRGLGVICSRHGTR